MREYLAKLFGLLASMKLTVVLLGLSIVLIFAGTLAQTELGIWEVMRDYFRSFIVYIPLRLFLPQQLDTRMALPFPGGYTIGSMMLLNLLAAHTLRFRVKARGSRLVIGLILLPIGIAAIAWLHNGPLPSAILTRSGGYAGVLPLMAIGALFYLPLVIGCLMAFGRRSGVVLIHAALILLLAGEGVTARTAIETQMPIFEGATSYWAQDSREVEFSVVDPSAPDTDHIVVVPQSMLIKAARTGEPIEHPDLPFTITVDRYYPNSELRRVDGTLHRSGLERGIGLTTMAVNRAKVSGIDPSRSINVPAAYVTLHTPTAALGSYLVSPHLLVDQYVIAEQDVAVGGKTVRIALRFRRYYKPYGMRLAKFNHDLYPGTNIPKNFSSDLRLIDPQQQVDRDIVIRMNSPLRYAGETFFQSSWIPGAAPGTADRGTVLMVVRNPGWTIPYIACAMGTIGLMLQFGSTLRRFLKRSRA